MGSVGDERPRKLGTFFSQCNQLGTASSSYESDMVGKDCVVLTSHSGLSVCGLAKDGEAGSWLSRNSN